MTASARKILDDLRRARALVIHPRDEEGAALLEQLRRLGCAVSLAWPPPRRAAGRTSTPCSSSSTTPR